MWPICDYLGLSWGSQRNRSRRNAVLSQVARNISVFMMNSLGQGQNRQKLALPLNYQPGWPFGVDVNRVNEAMREPLARTKSGSCFLP